MANLTMKKADIFAAMTIVPICLYVFYESGRWPVEATIGTPTLIPRGVATCVLFAAGMLLFRALTGKSLPLESKLEGKNIRRVILTGLITAGYVLVIERVGFIATTFVYMFLFIWILGERRWSRLILFSIVVSIAIYSVFDVGLHVPLPRGLLR